MLLNEERTRGPYRRWLSDLGVVSRRAPGWLFRFVRPHRLIKRWFSIVVEGTPAFKVIDCGVHPVPRSSKELARHVRQPWGGRGIPARGSRPYREWFPDWCDEANDPGGAPAGSDPERLKAHVLQEAEKAVLLPLGTGSCPSVEQDVAIAIGMNDWLAETWLSPRANADGRLKGSIRVCPYNARAAVQEIERWVRHPHMVQIAVPLEARAPYGQPQFVPIWEAAAHYGLPVAVHADEGQGIGFPPAVGGFPSHFIEFHTLVPFNAMLHLTSLICEGVFERLPSLRFIFADGGFDLAITLLWRLDREWRACRDEVPWVSRRPLSYLREHVRFVVGAADGPEGSGDLATVLAMRHVGDMVVFGSNYPRWDRIKASDLRRAVPGRWAPAIFHDNAASIYDTSRIGEARE